MRLDEALHLDPVKHPEAARYDVTGVLGAGAMGQVLLGRDRKLSREVAIKILAPEEVDLRNTARFYREAKTLAAIQHPSVMQILDFSGADCPVPFIVSERLSGCDLGAVIAARLLSETEALAVGQEVASALQAAHALGVVHRDLKPTNIFVQPNGRVVLIDFGFAVGVQGDNQRDTFAAHATAMMGTPDFADPEQVGGPDALSPQSDLFSLGSTLYFAVSQVLPFRGEGIYEVMTAVAQADPIPVADLVNLSEGGAELIASLLAKSPKDRPDSADAVRARCAELLQAQKAPPVATLVAQIFATRVLPQPEVKPLNELRVTAPQAAPPEGLLAKAARTSGPTAKVRTTQPLSDQSLFAKVKNAQLSQTGPIPPLAPESQAVTQSDTEVFTREAPPQHDPQRATQQTTQRYVQPQRSFVPWVVAIGVVVAAAAAAAWLLLKR